jgi:hypothetical protein
MRGWVGVGSQREAQERMVELLRGELAAAAADAPLPAELESVEVRFVLSARHAQRAAVREGGVGG